MKAAVLSPTVACFILTSCASETTTAAQKSSETPTSVLPETSAAPTTRPLAELLELSGADRILGITTADLQVGQTVIANLDSH